MKLCVFQGTFNPIHNAHIRVANFVAEKYDFDKILFIPAFQPPHKELDLNLSQHRFNMVKLAISKNSKFDISDIEFKRKGKSYTYLTICELYKKFDIEGKINFIIGTDAFEKIETWYKTNELKKIVEFIVFIRGNDFDTSKLESLKNKGYVFKLDILPFEDISSTQLRYNVKNGKDIKTYTNKEVEEYIKKHGLYKS